jgi:hypothetical protein
MRLFQMLLAMIGATVLLGACVGSASAGNLSLSSQTFRVTFRNLTFSGGFGEVECQTTLEGSLHGRTMAKVIGSLIGYITRAIVGHCEIGSATILRETLPWHVRYSGFEAILPEITSLIVHTETRFRIREPFGITCLFASTAERPATLTFHRSKVTHELTEAQRGGTITAGAGCTGITGTISSGNEPVMALNSLTAITVTLI